MPRLSHSDYVASRESVDLLWRSDLALLGLLSTTEQRALFDFYGIGLQLNEAALAAHRQTVTKGEPSLPRRAGAALARLERLLAVPMTAPVKPLLPTGHRTSARHIVVRPVLRPHPDLRLLARALLETAREIQRREQDDDQEAS